ncbi:MAG TPA: carboxypeptidase-like regulatory domain-containing protein [Gemmatimonadaceae bacterium]|nr:carboxypeptidase-like regulatory domain-containing protein [Gemmatimonadaceae bacterium]
MKSSRLVLGGAALLLACSDRTRGGPTGTGTPAMRSWAVGGVVRDQDGRAVAGATIDIVEGLFSGRSSISNGDGSFAFERVFGRMTLVVSRGGYEQYVQRLNVTTDVLLDVRLVKYVDADSLQLGRIIRATVSSNAPPCDAIRWDELAPCKRFFFTPDRAGTLSVSVSWSGSPELDITMVTLEGAYIATSIKVGPEAAWLVGIVEPGRTYEIRVNSYYTAQMFDLRADFQ